MTVRRGFSRGWMVSSAETLGHVNARVREVINLRRSAWRINSKWEFIPDESRYVESRDFLLAAVGRFRRFCYLVHTCAPSELSNNNIR